MRLNAWRQAIVPALFALAAGAASFASAQPRERWEPIGPAPIRDDAGGSNAGRITSLSVDSTDPRHWLAGAAAGGVWRTTDAGASWTPLTDAQPSLATGAVAIAPGRPNVYYAGTGDRAGSVGTYAGAGLLRSTDAGASWTLLAARTFAGAAFSALAVDPRDARVLVATTERGAAGLDPDLAPPRVPPRGIFKSTDGGVTWTQKGPRDPESNDATDLAVDPSSFARMFAAVGSHPPGATNGLHRSTDAGETWSAVDGPWTQARGATGRAILALAPSNPSVLYVAVTDASTYGLLGLWRTNDAWSPAPAWTRVPTDATDGARPGYGFSGTRGWFALRLSVDPRDADTLFAGGVRLWKCAACGAAPRWTPAPADLHADQHALAWAGARLVAGNDGGVWSSTDGGATWSAHNDGLAVTQFWAGCLHPWRSDWALGGSQDNGAARWSGAQGWAWVGVAGDGGSCAVSSSAPDTHWEEGLLRTLDGAATRWQDASVGIDWSEPKVFVTPIAKCPANDDVFVAALTSVWRSDDFFRASAPAWTVNGGPWGETLSAVAFAPGDGECRTYAVGSRGGRVLRLTTDSGATWLDLDPGGVLPAGYVSALAFDPSHSGALYVAYARFSGAPGGHLFRATNVFGGAPAWTDVGPPVDLPHNTLAFDPARPGTLYVGTDDGLWVSSDGGLDWTRHGPAEGLPRVPVYDVQVSPGARRVVAFTHGRGAFKLLRADLELRASVARRAEAPDEPAAVTVVITNRGPDAAREVTLDGPPARGLDPSSVLISQGECEARDGALHCRLGALAAGAEATLTLRADVSALGGALEVASDVVDPDPRDDTARLGPSAARQSRER